MNEPGMVVARFSLPVLEVIIRDGRPVGVRRRRLEFLVPSPLFDQNFADADVDSDGCISVDEFAAGPGGLELVLSNGIFRPVPGEFDWALAWAQADLPHERLVGLRAVVAMDLTGCARLPRKRGQRGSGRAGCLQKDWLVSAVLAERHRAEDKGLPISLDKALEIVLGHTYDEERPWPAAWEDEDGNGFSTLKTTVKRESAKARRHAPGDSVVALSHSVNVSGEDKNAPSKE